jgi:glycosyltransferase involved in cell wall biosynthesis
MFEYMASGLPVVAPRLDRIPSLVADGVEGVLYDPPRDANGHGPALAEALLALAEPERRKHLGAAARARAVSDYSWDAHCRALAGAISAARRR